MPMALKSQVLSSEKQFFPCSRGVMLLHRLNQVQERLDASRFLLCISGAMALGLRWGDDALRGGDDAAEFLHKLRQTVFTFWSQFTHCGPT